MTELVHQFSVQQSKHAFYSDAGDEALANIPLSADDAALLGYKPYLIVGLYLEGLGQHSLRLACAKAPLNPAQFLVSQWESLPNFFGRPDRLKVHRAVAQAWPELEAFVSSLGVRYEVASGHDKSITAGMRALQENARYAGWGPLRDGTQPFSMASAAATDRWPQYDLERMLHEKKTRERAQELSKRPRWSLPGGTQLPDLAWADEALFAIGQKSIPRVSAVSVLRREDRFVVLGDRLQDDTGDSVLWLGEHAFEDVGGGVMVPRSADPELLFMVREDIAAVMDSWPTGIAGLARKTKITKQRLQDFLRPTGELTQDELNRLLAAVNIEFQEYGSSALGDIVLVARKRKQIHRAHDTLSHGGDLEFCAEILPANGNPDPTWRMVLAHGHNGFSTLILFDRASPISAMLDEPSMHLINQTEAERIADSKYRKWLKRAHRALGA